MRPLRAIDGGHATGLIYAPELFQRFQPGRTILQVLGIRA